MTITAIIGTLLLLWVVWDLFNGSVWLHREFHRAQEPLAYWTTLLLWLAVAISCFFWEL
ncbi:hypothetical protein [Aliamphritea ceti]|uniref:hypothetical protein n=1 Tax=Aliamphritea ceti TaxID=1524258 RepID=UPI0021C27E66|nr:hypothetical protein [Aliamphritea ceti]